MYNLIIENVCMMWYINVNIYLFFIYELEFFNKFFWVSFYINCYGGNLNLE